MRDHHRRRAIQDRLALDRLASHEDEPQPGDGKWERAGMLIILASVILTLAGLLWVGRLVVRMLSGAT